ncbi:restriction endonuclease [Acinetobacter sp. ANC 5380]|uniref:Restriction endonuclease n=2 Tax=Acinetobacter Taxon 24 TaxID=2839056 RepID=A0AAW6UX96_9GAMM|nr:MULTISPECIES: restriction endonuclease [Acinetobacter Taxon 24]MDK1684928.1 restriction endonuclease [Acinetobacter terrestris]NNH78045.1 restriction endonuclease [Acinetobacter terrae]
MALPTYDQLMLPLMKLLSEQKQGMKLSDAARVLSERSGLSSEELSLRLSSGTKTVFYDRVGWAKTYLVKAGLISQPKRGFCELSEIGRRLDLSKLTSITIEYLMQYESFSNYKLGISKENQKIQYKVDKEISHIHKLEETRTPDEIITETTELLKSNLKSDLLQMVKDKSPAFFERLVVDLLVAMGYGGSHQDAAQAIGKTNDGGIDGVISEDRLGLDKIYIQAKRWENTVGRPDIQQFKGALADQVAKKGVFITTSNFSKEAIESAKKSGIVLIDGDKLTSLMIEFGLGVQVERSFHIYKIDQDRFDEDNY